MPQDGVPDDGQPQPRPSGLPRTAFVDPVEPFEEPRQVLFGHSAAVVVDRQRDRLVVRRDRADGDPAASRIGQRVVEQVAEDGCQQRGIARDAERFGDGVHDSDPPVLGRRGEIVAHLGDDLPQVDFALSDRFASVLHAGDQRHVVQQVRQTFAVGVAAGHEFVPSLRREVLVGHQRFEARAHRCHRGLEFVVNVVRELPFDPDPLLLRVQGEAMFAVAVGDGLLELCVEPYDVVGYVAQFVVRKGLGVEDALSAFGLFGEAVEPRDVESYPARGEIPQQAHRGRHSDHEPEESVVGAEQHPERYGIGYGRADDPVPAPARRIEIGLARAFAVPPDGVSRSVSESFGDLRPFEMVLRRQRIERIVVDDTPPQVDHADPQSLYRRQFAEVRHGVALPDGLEQRFVEHLQADVQLLGLEPPFAVILERRETEHHRPQTGDQPQKQPAVVGRFTP